MPTTQNLGIVKAIHIGTSAPTNLQMLWYDTTVNEHKYYNVVTGIWTSLIGGGNASVISVQGKVGVVTLDSDEITEGVVNLYYTNNRFDASFAAKDTDDLTEGATNKYFTATAFDAEFGTKTTDDLTEGSTNLYYTDARARAAYTGVSPISVNATTGVISMSQAGATTDGWLSSADWNAFNNSLNPPSGTLDRIVKFTPSGSALGDSTITETAGSINFGGNLSITDNHMSFQDVNASNNKLNAFKIDFQSTTNASSILKLSNSSVNGELYGIHTTLGNSKLKGAIMFGQSGFNDGTIPVWNDTGTSLGGYVTSVRNNEGKLSGLRAIVDQTGTDPSSMFAYGAWLTVTSSNATSYPLRLENGNDNTNKILKVIDADGHVDFSTITAVQAGTPQTTNHLTKWSSNSNEIVNSSIKDDGSTIAIGSALLDNTKSMNFSPNENFGIYIKHDPPQAQVPLTSIPQMNSAIQIDSQTFNSMTEMKAGIAIAVSGGGTEPTPTPGSPPTVPISDSRYVGFYSIVSSSDDGTYTPTFDANIYDLIQDSPPQTISNIPGSYLNSIASVGGMFTAISSDRINYGIRVRADNDNVAENIGLYIRTRNGVGTQCPIVIDSPNKGAGKVLTSDANGKGDWQTISQATGTVTVASTGSYDLNYITKWDAVANDIIASQIQDDGTTIAMGDAVLNSARYLAIESSTEEDIIHITQTKATGNPAAIYAEAIGAVVGTNNAAHFKAINGGTNYPLRLENGGGAANNGKYLKVIDDDGNIDFAVAGTGSVTDQAGGQNLHYITKWTANDEIGDSSIVQSATTSSIGIGTAATTFGVVTTTVTAAAQTGFLVDTTNLSFTGQKRGGYFRLFNTNTAANAAIEASSMNSSTVNVGVYGLAGHSLTPAPENYMSSNVGMMAIAKADNTGSETATGMYARVEGKSNSDNIGISVFATNSGTGGKYALKLVDGTEGNNKVLTSDANGNASWQTSQSASNFYTTNDTVGANRVATITDFPKFSGAQANPIGLEIENTTGGSGGFTTMGAQLKLTNAGATATVSYYNSTGAGVAALEIDSPTRILYKTQTAHSFTLANAGFDFTNDSTNTIFRGNVGSGGQTYTELQLAYLNSINYCYINSPVAVADKVMAFGRVAVGTTSEFMRIDQDNQLGVNSDGLTISAQLHVKRKVAGGLIGRFENNDDYAVLDIGDDGMTSVLPSDGNIGTGNTDPLGITFEASKVTGGGANDFARIGDTFGGGSWIQKLRGTLGRNFLWIGRSVSDADFNNIVINGPNTGVNTPRVSGGLVDKMDDTALYVWGGQNRYGIVVSGSTQPASNGACVFIARTWGGVGTTTFNEFFKLDNDKKMTYADGTQSANRYLQCDQNGKASWVDLSVTSQNIATNSLTWTADTTQDIDTHKLTFETANVANQLVIDNQYSGIFIGMAPAGAGAAVNITNPTPIYMASGSAGYGNSKFKPYQPGQLHHRWEASGGAIIALDASDKDVHVMGAGARLGINLGSVSPTAHLDVKQTIENEEVIKATNASGTNVLTIDSDGIYTGGTADSWVFYRGGSTTGTNFSGNANHNNFYFGGNGSLNQTRFFIKSGDGTTEAAGLSAIYLQDAIISENQSTGEMVLDVPTSLYLDAPDTHTSGNFGVNIKPRTFFDVLHSTDGTLTSFSSNDNPWVFQSNHNGEVNMNIISNSESSARLVFKNQAGSDKGYVRVLNNTGDLELGATNDVFIASGTKMGIGGNAPTDSLTVEDGNIRVINGQMWSDYDNGGVTANVANVNFNNGNSYFLDLANATGNVTVNFTNAKEGASYFLVIKQKSSSPVDISTYSTAGGSVLFPDGTAPTISTGANAYDTIVFYCAPGGDLYGNFAQNYS